MIQKGKELFSREKFFGIKWSRVLLFALKVALASSFAVHLAQVFQLQHAESAGTIALLTIMTTKWETLKLSLARLFTMFITIAAAWLVFSRIESLWIAYGIFIFIMVFFLAGLGLQATISVNSVMGVHLLSNHDFSAAFIRNEIFLVMIGITTAFVVNLFNDNIRQKAAMEKSISSFESKLQMILGELAAYLAKKAMQRNVWEDIRLLEQELSSWLQTAYEYRENSFSSHSEYYIRYFEMRQNQCHILQNLHSEMQMIKEIPRQALVVSNYLIYLMDFVTEHTVSGEQVERLEMLFSNMREEELPKTREEFENRAILYHILMDIEDFLICKQRFVNELSDKQKKIYWTSSEGPCR